MTTIKECRICLNNKLETIYIFPKVPYGDLYKNSKEEAIRVEKNSLNLLLCKSCSLLQLDENTKSEIQYREYLYRTSITNSLSSYYEKLAKQLISYVNNFNGSCLDIGCNDGSLLRIMKNYGYFTLGIEPAANLTLNFDALGIDYINKFFNRELSEEIFSKYGKFDLIFMNFVLANVNKIHDFVSGITQLMKENSILCVVTGYHPDQFQINMFDYINHDHISYFTLRNLKDLFGKYDLALIDAFRFEQKGGSITALFKLNSRTNLAIDGQVHQLLQRESWLEVSEKSFYDMFFKKVEIQKEKSLKYLKTKKNKVIGVGASISSTYLSSFFEISNFFKNLYDDDVSKISRFAPGSGIEVKALSEISNEINSFAYLLSWQHSNKIISRLKELNYKGELAIPLPNLKIINL